MQGIDRALESIVLHFLNNPNVEISHELRVQADINGLRGLADR
jgi:hypothetical protein